MWSADLKSYTELAQIKSFEERYEYLQLRSNVGVPTFGYERWIDQNFYRSRQWKLTRQDVIARDEGCDLGITGYEIYDRIIIHHMNPMTPDQIEGGDPDILNPEYLISTTHQTHNAIHFGDKRNLVQPIVERRPGDTNLWGR